MTLGIERRAERAKRDFGGLTREALALYQSASGIMPASGYFGVLTRAQLKASDITGLWW